MWLNFLNPYEDFACCTFLKTKLFELQISTVIGNFIVQPHTWHRWIQKFKTMSRLNILRLDFMLIYIRRLILYGLMGSILNWERLTYKGNYWSNCLGIFLTKKLLFRFKRPFNCWLGEPQGGVLSPTLFAIYIIYMLSGISGFGKCLQYGKEISYYLNIQYFGNLRNPFNYTNRLILWILICV